jgi:hypothetical protein
MLHAHIAVPHVQRKRANPKKVASAIANLTVTAKLTKKKRQHEAGVKLLRQVSYRQETYRAVRYV